MDWIVRKELEGCRDEHEHSDFVYIDVEGYSDTAFGIDAVPVDASHFIVLPPQPDTGE